MSSEVSPRSNKLQMPEPVVKVLNISDSAATASSATDAAKQLQKLMLKMKGSVIAADGSGVKYSELKENQLFVQYKQQAAALRLVNLETLTEIEKKSFFINVYNALTIHGLAECEKLPNSVLDIQAFWKTTAYNLGGYTFSLDDLEHGLLRGNRPHPSSTQPPFADSDPRKKFVMKNLDPRIHFALVCGAKSCPAIQIYTPENIEGALDAATKNFCEQETKVHLMQKEIFVSMIFQWYGGDFGTNDVETIRWTLPYLSEQKRSNLDTLLHTMENIGMVDLIYSDYNWNLNKI